MVRWTSLALLVLPLMLAAACRDDGGEASTAPTPTEPAAPEARLAIHHIDTEQGDAILIVSPGGETAMVDDGRSNKCSEVISYLEGIGVASIEYHFASHYDDDHIGCMDDMAAAGITVAAACYDRGGTKQKNRDEFNAYVAACGAKRQTVSEGQVTTLDQASAIPVTITVVALAGAGIDTEPDQENALSLVLVLSYGSFDEVLGGDLTGSGPDIESAVAAQVGDVEVYKVHHHGSKHASSDAWLSETTPEVAIISVGGNAYGHPTAEALERMHTRGIKTYWTNPGSGATPDPEMDYVGGTIIVRALPAPGGEFTVSGDGFTDTYVSQ